MTRERLRFPLLFFGLLALFSVIGESELFHSGVRAPLCRVLARTSAAALAAVGVPARASGDLVTAGGFTAAVHTDCDGIVLLGLFLAAVLAFPSGWRASRLPATALGVASLVLLNWLRVVALIYSGYLDPELFRTTHVYAWQALLMLGTLLVFVAWAQRTLRLEQGARQSEAGLGAARSRAARRAP